MTASKSTRTDAGLQLFISYSHRDTELRERLEAHLAMLRRENIISLWNDRCISAGSDVHDEISENLENSHIILLLVSADFINSDYCYEREMTRALERHNNGEATVIPVILSPCEWQQTPFSSLRNTPGDGQAITGFSDTDQAFNIVAKDIREAVARINVRRNPTLEENATNPDKTPARPVSGNVLIRKTFTDLEKNQFIKDSFSYIAKFFETSLKALERNNSHISVEFESLDRHRITLAIYMQGSRQAACTIWLKVGDAILQGIFYSEQYSADTSSFNESLSVENDGYVQHLKPMGMLNYSGNVNKALDQQQAAEYLWDSFVSKLQ